MNKSFSYNNNNFQQSIIYYSSSTFKRNLWIWLYYNGRIFVDYANCSLTVMIFDVHIAVSRPASRYNFQLLTQISFQSNDFIKILQTKI